MFAQALPHPRPARCQANAGPLSRYERGAGGICFLELFYARWDRCQAWVNDASRVSVPKRKGISHKLEASRSVSLRLHAEERSAGLGKFFDRVDEPVAVIFVERDRQREHAPLGEPDTVGEEVEMEQVAQ